MNLSPNFMDLLAVSTDNRSEKVRMIQSGKSTDLQCNDHALACFSLTNTYRYLALPFSMSTTT